MPPRGLQAHVESGRASWNWLVTLAGTYAMFVVAVVRLF
jgi:hypothetical protein